MKIKIKTAVASPHWHVRPRQIIDTSTHPFVDEKQAVAWLNAGIAEAVRMEAPVTEKAVIEYEKPKARKKKAASNT
jgi:hypothetical protein